MAALVRRLDIATIEERATVFMAAVALAALVYAVKTSLGWSLFSDVVTRCLTIFIENGNLLKKTKHSSLATSAVSGVRIGAGSCGRAL